MKNHRNNLYKLKLRGGGDSQSGYVTNFAGHTINTHGNRVSPRFMESAVIARPAPRSSEPTITEDGPATLVSAQPIVISPISQQSHNDLIEAIVAHAGSVPDGLFTVRPTAYECGSAGESSSKADSEPDTPIDPMVIRMDQCDPEDWDAYDWDHFSDILRKEWWEDIGGSTTRSIGHDTSAFTIKAHVERHHIGAVYDEDFWDPFVQCMSALSDVLKSSDCPDYLRRKLVELIVHFRSGLYCVSHWYRRPDDPRYWISFSPGSSSEGFISRTIQIERFKINIPTIPCKCSNNMLDSLSDYKSTCKFCTDGVANGSQHVTFPWQMPWDYRAWN